jgi:hypothetical protein
LAFEQPQKGDLDRKLSELMHETKHRQEENRVRIVSEATTRGALTGSRVVVIQVDAADHLHREAMERAAAFLFDFIEHTGREATEVVTWARPHLENLSDSLIGTVQAYGSRGDRDRLVRQYRAVFHQRLTSTLRDVQIGYASPEGFARAGAEADRAHERSGSAGSLGVERRLEDHPQDARAAARALSKAIGNQIDELNASRLNDPDALDRQEGFVEFLQRIASGLDDLATSLEATIDAASPETKKSTAHHAASVAHNLAGFVREGFDKQRPAIQACVINGPLLAGAVWLFHALGVDPNMAFAGMGTIMGFKMVSKGEPKD